ncbi:MLP-like protein 34 [Vicia villosa]|uniref:MLP-like protein 34 n=1 Tax=Vicia villosa TaxID=3911 RepID=UPI00273AC861|nr:MLP-like protein 34 [Vicia villosa]
MSLSGKVVSETEIEATAAKFYNIFRKQLGDVPSISPEVHENSVHEGDWENIGSVKHWEYTIEGRKHTTKEKIESLDDENKVIIYSVYDGDVADSYKSFKVTLPVIDKEHGGVVKWSIEYEKLKEDITAASPDSYLVLFAKITKDIDAHLVKE